MLPSFTVNHSMLQQQLFTQVGTMLHMPQVHLLLLQFELWVFLVMSSVKSFLQLICLCVFIQWSPCYLVSDFFVFLLVYVIVFFSFPFIMIFLHAAIRLFHFNALRNNSAQF